MFKQDHQQAHSKKNHKTTRYTIVEESGTSRVPHEPVRHHRLNSDRTRIVVSTRPPRPRARAAVSRVSTPPQV
jgi:hypothetical protein